MDPESGSAGKPVELKGDSSVLGLSSGQLYLVAVAALWGSYAPALRYAPGLVPDSYVIAKLPDG